MNDAGTAIAVDSSGDAYVVGWTDSSDFPLAGAPYQSKMRGESGRYGYRVYGDAFVTLVNSTGTALLYSTYLGGTSCMKLRDWRRYRRRKATVFVTGGTIPKDFPFSSPNWHAESLWRRILGHVFHDLFRIPSGPSRHCESCQRRRRREHNHRGEYLDRNQRFEFRRYHPDVGIRGLREQSTADLKLDNISVLMNGKAAYVFYISPTQVNVLTPPDLGTGAISVQVSVNGVTSQAFVVQAQTVSPSFAVATRGCITY